MHLLYCDETNFERTPGDFFVYGGLAVPPDAAASLAAQVSQIRANLGVPREYVFKFNPGPAQFTHQQFIELKSQAIAACVSHGCKLFVNLVLHDVSSSSEDARRFGINTLCYHFDCHLSAVSSPGLVLIDRFDDRQIDGQLRERHAIGLTGQLPYSAEMPIRNIVGFHFTAIGTSHFCSLVDVVLGSLRFAVNAHTRGLTQHRASSEAILRSIAPLFGAVNGGRVPEINLSFSPRDVRVPSYRDRYDRLKSWFNENGISCA